MARPTSGVTTVVLTGPLGPFADVYRERLEERGYTQLSAVNLQRQVAQMSRWLVAERLGIEELGEARVEAFLATQRASRCQRHSLSRPGLVCLLELLRELGVVSAAVPPALSPTDALMCSFLRYLVSERGLSAGTARGYVDRAARSRRVVRSEPW